MRGIILERRYAHFNFSINQKGFLHLTKIETKNEGYSTHYLRYVLGWHRDIEYDYCDTFIGDTVVSERKNRFFKFDYVEITATEYSEKYGLCLTFWKEGRNILLSGHAPFNFLPITTLPYLIDRGCLSLSEKQITALNKMFAFFANRWGKQLFKLEISEI